MSEARRVTKGEVHPFRICPLGDDKGDRAWVERFMTEQWGAALVVAHDTVYHPASLPGFVAWQAGERVGLVTYHRDGQACEIVTLDSQRPGIDVGTAFRCATRLS